MQYTVKGYRVIKDPFELVVEASDGTTAQSQAEGIISTDTFVTIGDEWFIHEVVPTDSPIKDLEFLPRWGLEEY